MTIPRILFATIAAGGGHVATAQAMADAVQKFFPGAFEATVSDLMLDLGLSRQDQQHKSFWKWALAHPKVVRTGQRILDAAPTLTRRYQRIMLRRLAKLAAAKLRGDPPALVVANHSWLTVGLTLAQRRYGLATRVLSFATEPLDASALWAEPRAERFIVPSEYTKRDLVRLGVNPDKVDVVGYPIRQAFLEPYSKQQAREQLALEERFTCLITLGGEGIGNDPVDWLEKLLQRNLAVIVMTGRNEELRKQLLPLARRAPQLRVEGFTDNMATFLAASDVIIGKAGPASVFEALAVGRPFLVTNYAGLNERKVVEFLETRKLGAFHPHCRTLITDICRYQQHPEELHRVKEATLELELPKLTEALARYIVDYAATGERNARWVGHGLL